MMRNNLRSWIIYRKIRNLSKEQKEYPSGLSNANVAIDETSIAARSQEDAAAMDA
ncbi:MULTISPECIES: hypothetical protein [unclassified Methylobacterium]|uniref:hypothetical protein n=1 Tax=unclassified Methylobacterium TaxID=2615210 RepID=UPI000A9DAA89|nr:MULTISPECIES: hypothetical protein [unclassified Methylobacterium]